MNNIHLFTDAATSPQREIAVGAYLFLNQQDIEVYTEYNNESLFSKLADIVIYKEYVSKKSTWSEIKTVIHALDTVCNNSEPSAKIDLYTDCQSLCDLLGRRKEKLKQNNFITRRGKIFQNADLYQELFAVAEKFHINVIKMKGHKPMAYRLTVQEKMFAILDKLSRRRLRELLSKK